MSSAMVMDSKAVMTQQKMQPVVQWGSNTGMVMLGAKARVPVRKSLGNESRPVCKKRCLTEERRPMAWKQKEHNFGRGWWSKMC